MNQPNRCNESPECHKHQPKAFVVLPPNLHKRNGARAGNRTLNLGIKSPLLCQLSYASMS